jgi:RHS repeat-associated protein
MNLCAMVRDSCNTPATALLAILSIASLTAYSYAQPLDILSIRAPAATGGEPADGADNRAVRGTCAVECPPGALQSFEPDCGPEYVDSSNGGCNWVPFVFESISVGDTVCGTAGTYVLNGDAVRDTDWYEVALTGNCALHWEVQAEFAVQIAIIDGSTGCPPASILAFDFAGPCDMAAITTTGLNPGVYWLFVSPQTFAGVPCSSRYTGRLSCVPVPCLCQNCTAVATLSAGTFDNFSGPEPAAPRPQLEALMSCALGAQGFDESAVDRCFGHTFEDFGTQLLGATLTLRVRAGATSAACNDALSLGIQTESSTFGWSHIIGGPGGACPTLPAGLVSGAWTAGRIETIVLDLASLPNADGSTTNLLPLINSSRALDIMIQDDTNVDFISLNYTYCPCDCNGNGIQDDCDIDPGDPDGDGRISLDCNHNNTPDECERVGACCLSDGRCQIVNSCYCSTMGGSYMGDNSTCIDCPEICCPSDPAYESPPVSPPAQPCECGAGRSAGPINLFSGEFVTSAEDLAIPGRGLDFKWVRTYRSRFGPDTEQGNGWDFSYNIRIEQSGSDRTLYDGFGRHDTYLLQPDNTWGLREFFRQLILNPDGTYTLIFPDTGKWHFHAMSHPTAPGKISVIEDRNGNALALFYDAGGRLITVQDTLHTASNNRQVQIAYNADGQIESVTDFIGRQVRYTYYADGDPDGSAGDLRSATSPAVTGTPTGNDFPAGKTMIYTYSTGFDRPCLNHNLLSMTDPKGQTFLTLEYGTSPSPSQSNGLLCDRVLRAVWGDPGDNIDIVYLPEFPTPANHGAVMRAIVNDRMGHVSASWFDARNRLVMLREYTGTANPDQPTTATTNLPANPLRADDPPFFQTVNSYNDDSLVTLTVYPNGNSVQKVYELALDPAAARRSRGNLREMRRNPGLLGGDQSQLVDLFEYDMDMGGCCGTNFVTKWTDPRLNVTLHTYDSHGNRLHTQHPIPTVIEDWEYNTFGQMTAHTLPFNGIGSGHRRRDEYDHYSETDGAQYGYVKNEVVDAGFFGLSTTHEYDAAGNVIRTIDPRGNDTLYSVNQLNQIVRELSPEVDLSGQRYARDTYYDANNNVVREDVENAGPPGTPSCTFDPTNPYLTTVHEYEILNKRIRTCEESGHYSGAIPGPTDQPTCSGLPASEFITNEYEYDDNRNLVLTRHGEAAEGRQPFNVEARICDERGMLYREIRAPGAPEQSTVQYDYDRNRNRRTVHSGLESGEHLTVNTFDGYNRLTSTSDPMGNVTTYHYDPNGNQVSAFVTGDRFDLPGNEGKRAPLSEIHSEYDPLNRKLKIRVRHLSCAKRPVGDGWSVNEFVYADIGEILRATDDNGRQTQFEYDTANRPLTRTDAKLNRVQYAYDAGGNTATITEIEKSDLGAPDRTYVTSTTYDSLNRPIQMIDNIGNTSRFAYDSRNNPVEAADPLGNLTCYDYDGVDRLIRTEKILTDDGTGSGSTIGSIVTTQLWDDSHRLVEQTDDNGHSTLYGYDPLDRRTSTVFADTTGTTSLYDAHDRVVQASDANGNFVASFYDANDRLVNRTIFPGLGVSADTTFEDFVYDGLGRVVYAANDDTVVVRCYDSLSNIVEESLTIAGSVRTMRAVYDGERNQICCTYPGGRVVVRSFDGLNRPKVISDGVCGNPPLPTSMIGAYSYVGPNRVERREHGNGTRADFEYDGVANAAGDFGVRRAVRTRHSLISGGTVIDERTCSWNRAGQKKHRRDERPGGPMLRHDYALDSVYRLIHTSVNDAAPSLVRSTDYALDGAGNRIAVGGTPDPGAYLMSAATPQPADFQTNQYTHTPLGQRTYDLNGNLIRFGAGNANGNSLIDFADFAILANCMNGPNNSVPLSCDLLDFNADFDVDLLDFQAFQPAFSLASFGPAAIVVYDYRNRMVEYRLSPAGQRHTYAYDALGRRIRRVVDADGAPRETRYYYFGWRVIEEQSSAGLTQATYVDGSYFDDVIHMRRAGVDYYYHADDRYNVMAVSAAGGAVVERYDYQDFGTPEIFDAGGAPLAQSGIGNPRLFAGRFFDAETGWYEYRTRYLDPRTGRFTTRDRIGIWGDPDNAGNGFTYVSNRPCSGLDPSGEFQTPLIYLDPCQSIPNFDDSVIVPALKEAEDMTKKAFEYLKTLDSRCKRSHSKFFTDHFKGTGGWRWHRIKHRFHKTLKFIQKKEIRFTCRDEYLFGYSVPIYRPHWIQLGTRFWTAPPKGPDSQASTIVHEVTHLVSLTHDDEFWINVFENRNAYNHEYFAAEFATDAAAPVDDFSECGVDQLPYAMAAIVGMTLSAAVWRRWRACRAPSGKGRL